MKGYEIESITLFISWLWRYMGSDIRNFIAFPASVCVKVNIFFDIEGKLSKLINLSKTDI